MALKWYTRIKFKDKEQFDRQIALNEVLFEHGRIIDGVQLNLAHPALMYTETNGLTEEYVLKRLIDSPLSYIVHGPAGGQGVDLGCVFDEFGIEKRLESLQGSSNFLEFNIGSVQNAVNIASILNQKGKLAHPYIIQHPGFTKEETCFESALFLNQIFRKVDQKDVEIVFETTPWFHVPNLDSSLMKEQLKTLEKKDEFPPMMYFGMGGFPEHMEYVLDSILEDQKGIKIFPDFTHIQVLANQVKKYGVYIATNNHTFSELINAYLDMPTIPICHVSGDTKKIVDEHRGTMAGVDGNFAVDVRNGIARLEKLHPDKDVVVVLEYGMGDEHIMSSREYFTP